MEQPCYKCGLTVDEGRVFCPHCRAPQIRVVLAGPATAMPATSPVQQGELTASETLPVIALPMRWGQAAQPCAVAAFIAALGMVLRLIVPVIAVVGAGFLAVALYRRRNPELAMRARTGARLGATCGFFSFGMTALLGALRVTILHEGAEVRAALGEIRTGLLEALQQQAGRYSAQQVQANLDFVRSPTGLVVLIVSLVIFALIILIVLGMLGGVLGGVGLGRRDRS
ncbi:MAG TPA: hypothetical protein VNS62_14840 [Candidatus Udaeobacter sp.]|nr:hypothetical protein [Candidatus Udaeobacter sp.]